MPHPETVENWRVLLAAQRRTLAVYLQQLANLGSDYAPPGVHNGAAEARAAIAQLKADLRAAGAAVEDEPSDDAQPSEASTTARGVRQAIEGGSGNIQASDSIVTVTNQYGDIIFGDKVAGDKVLGNKITELHYPDLPPLPPIDLGAALTRLGQLPTGDDAQIPTPATS